MKTALLVFCLLFAASAVGQMATGGTVLSSEPQRFEMMGHPAHASQVGMGTEQQVLEASVPAIERGERPLWEFAPKLEPTSLGDDARRLRKEHAATKKATIVWEN